MKGLSEEIKLKGFACVNLRSHVWIPEEICFHSCKLQRPRASLLEWEGSVNPTRGLTSLIVPDYLLRGPLIRLRDSIFIEEVDYPSKGHRVNGLFISD